MKKEIGEKEKINLSNFHVNILRNLKSIRDELIYSSDKISRNSIAKKIQLVCKKIEQYKI